MQASLLSDDEQSYFLEMESLFNHPGWDRLTREITAELEALPDDTLTHAKSWDDVLKARAKSEALKALAGYPRAVEVRRQHLETMRAQEIDGLNDL